MTRRPGRPLGGGGTAVWQSVGVHPPPGRMRGPRACVAALVALGCVGLTACSGRHASRGPHHPGPEFDGGGCTLHDGTLDDDHGPARPADHHVGPLGHRHRARHTGRLRRRAPARPRVLPLRRRRRDVQYVWRFLRSNKIDLSARKSWCESNDPNFAVKAADVVGLYVAPPKKAIVLCVDEKPSIQALERAQGYLKLPNGRALTGQSHDYKRHGTTTLFAALEVATGKIIATHSKRRRRVEFIDFMDSVTAAFPNRQLHVILDNLSTHKKNEPWLKAHPNVKFHFTPTSASWLNQVEVWFSILQGQSLSGASFTNLKQLEQHIDAYIKAYNDKAEPFVWTKKKVRQRRFKGRRITQL